MTHDATTAQLPLTMDELYNNQFLFSDHYLDALLPGDPRWEAAREEAAAFRAWLRDLYAREGERLDDYSENQLEEHWFKPIFERLGHVFETQARVPGLGKGIRRPDYAFFPTEDDRLEAAAIQKTEAYAQRALAVGEVKQWDIHLSKKQRSGETSFDRQNPSYQIDYYLKATGLTWGILANGRTWRLVHRETSYRLDTYYEVDLLKLLEQDDPAAIRYFYLFFRQAAFRPDDQGRVFLDDVLAGSKAYALALEEDLQENAYHALELLMQGFLEFGPNGLTANDLRAIYDNSLYLLYRLLFILYGESRGLLPVRNRRYNDLYGFRRLMKEITELLDEGTYVGRGGSRYYGALCDLFHLINGDDPNFNAEINVVRYNGGLFDPQQHPFLAQKSVSDRAFTRAVDLLCRRETESGSKEFVDYRTLNVRHLGSIYEGLLEYQPRLAAERMVAIRNGKGEQWLTASTAPQGAKVVERRAEGEIYLETDKGERKATGSYYTPQYIVAYIVAQTLGPLVEELRMANGMDDEPAVSQPQAGAALVDAVLDLKVLDPSMGSGHFLVEATDYLARALATDPYVETDEAADESDLNHWRRRVVERCIYGVDKNPLAVELAKLSLWLTTFAGDKPLGFLDHHLKCGDSLVGAQIADLEEQPEVLLSKKEQRQREKEAAAGAEQLGLGLFAGEFNRRLPEMLRELFAIMEAESVDYEAVRAKEAANARVERLKAPFQTVADLYTSAHFGNTYSAEAYKAALRAIGEPEKLHALPAVQAAEAIADERRFLHWELTFPEIFFDRVGAPLPEDAQGFDAVIGNPPWVSFGLRGVGKLEDSFQDYLRGAYPHSAEYKLSVYAMFMELSITLTRQNGYHSFIVPDSFLLGQYFSKIRNLILKQTAIAHIVLILEDFWPSGSVGRSVVYVLHRTTQPNTQMNLTLAETLEKFESQEICRNNYGQEFFEKTHLKRFRLFFNEAVKAIVMNMENQSHPLSNYVKFYSGLIGKRGQKSITIQGKPADYSPQKYGRLIHSGGNLECYSLKYSGYYIPHIPELYKSGYDVEKYLAPKLFLNQTGDSIKSCFDDQGFFCLNNMHIGYPVTLNLDLKFINALLCSRLMNFYYHVTSLEVGRAMAQTDIESIDQLPICSIDFTTPKAERAALVAQAIALYEDTLQQPASSNQQPASSNQPTSIQQPASSQPASSNQHPANQHPANQLLAFTADQPTDVIHDLLAHLAERMIALNRQKQQRIDAFYLDLEGVTDADTYAKLQKGKQGRTLWRAEACRPYVEEGSYTTHSLEESLGWTEAAYKAFVKKLAGKVSGFSDLVAAYRKHAPEYTARVQRIAATDRIIDRIVYQLYGLTEEEIAIVEGEAA